MNPTGALVTNPRIYIDAHGRFTDALWIQDGRITAIGQKAIAAANEAGVQPQSIRGQCLMPALADAHIHMWGLGMRVGNLNLRDATSTDQIYDQVAQAPDTEHGWILGSGWDQNRWTDSDTLDLAKLDRAARGRKVCLRRIDEHAIWVNSPVLSSVELPDGPLVGRDEHNRPNGRLVDDIMFRVTRQIPEATEAEDAKTCVQNGEMLRAFGIASAHIAWVEGNRLDMLRNLIATRQLNLRIHAMLDGKAPQFDQLFDDGPAESEDARLSLRAAKFFSDGALGSQGAQLIDGYRDGTRGAAVVPDEILADRIPKLVERGWQICIHAIGDLANRRVLNHYRALSEAERARTRPRIEHAQMVHDHDLDRFFDIIASLQPIHMFSDAPWVNRVIDDRYLHRLFRWKTIGKRSRLVCGSDFPIDDPNPWHGIATALSRVGRDGNTFQPAEALSRFQAIHGYTLGAAHAAFWEDEIGSLHIGKRADFIAVDTDPFVSTPAEIWETNVLGLWMDGELQ